VSVCDINFNLLERTLWVTVHILSTAKAIDIEVRTPRSFSAMVRAKSKAVAGPLLVTKLPGTGYD